jgi:hypothetical protein
VQRAILRRDSGSGAVAYACPMSANTSNPLKKGISAALGVPTVTEVLKPRTQLVQND